VQLKVVVVAADREVVRKGEEETVVAGLEGIGEVG
jgi:hypothetical protein